MRHPVYPEASCREAMSAESGMIYLCELVDLHPGPCASRSIMQSVRRRDAWEAANPGWESGIGQLDDLVETPHSMPEMVPATSPSSAENDQRVRDDFVAWVRSPERRAEALTLTLAELETAYSQELAHLDDVRLRLGLSGSPDPERIGALNEAVATLEARLRNVRFVIQDAQVGWGIKYLPED